MRIGLVAQWLRAGVEDPASRGTALRYAAGIAVAAGRAGCCGSRWPRPAPLPHALACRSSSCLVVLELAVPRWAERPRRDQLASAPHRRALRAVHDHPAGRERARRVDRVDGRARGGPGERRRSSTIAVAGLVLLFALWWLYFLEPAGDGLARLAATASYLWGYGHYGIFAALAALGAGLEVAVEQTGHHVAEVSGRIGYAVAVPVGGFLLLLWARARADRGAAGDPTAATLGATVFVLALPLAAESLGAAAVIAGIAVVCGVVIVVTIVPGRSSAAVG